MNLCCHVSCTCYAIFTCCFCISFLANLTCSEFLDPRQTSSSVCEEHLGTESNRDWLCVGSSSPTHMYVPCMCIMTIWQCRPSRLWADKHIRTRGSCNDTQPQLHTICPDIFYISNLKSNILCNIHVMNRDLFMARLLV